MKINISNTLLDEFSLKNSEYLVDKSWYQELSGTNEYRLYSYLTLFFNNITILDIGTFNGRSAVALSHNESNIVLSYDVVNHINNNNHQIYSKSNIKFYVKNVLDDLSEELLKNVKIVSIDIDHYGNNEKLIMDRLKELNYSGIILLDDIINHPEPEINKCMNEFWNNIKEEKKYDFTKYGHTTGTGIIIMNNNDIEFEFT
jgi:hypothetical protein